MSLSAAGALLLAICSNAFANVMLKRAMSGIEAEGPGAVAAALLRSGAFWAGIAGAVVLLGAYLLAIRSLPLGPTYAAVTSVTIALLTAWGLTFGQESLGWMKLAGVGAVILGIVLIVASAES